MYHIQDFIYFLTSKEKPIAMKTTIILILVFVHSLTLKAQPGVVAMPETMILYRGYDNKIVPVIPEGEQLILDVENATALPDSFEVNGNVYNGYILRPGGANTVSLKLKGRSSDGFIHDHGTFKYRVKAMPQPELMNDEISKRSGCRITLILRDSPLEVSYNVTGGHIATSAGEFIFFSGSVIPASSIAKMELGKEVVVVVNYTSNGGPSSLTAALKVVP